MPSRTFSPFLLRNPLQVCDAGSMAGSRTSRLARRGSAATLAATLAVTFAATLLAGGAQAGVVGAVGEGAKSVSAQETAVRAQHMQRVAIGATAALALQNVLTVSGMSSGSASTALALMAAAQGAVASCGVASSSASGSAAGSASARASVRSALDAAPVELSEEHLKPCPGEVSCVQKLGSWTLVRSPGEVTLQRHFASEVQARAAFNFVEERSERIRPARFERRVDERGGQTLSWSKDLSDGRLRLLMAPASEDPASNASLGSNASKFVVRWSLVSGEDAHTALSRAALNGFFQGVAKTAGDAAARKLTAGCPMSMSTNPVRDLRRIEP